MLSRTAENLYWVGRYLERAETNARLLEVGARIALLPNISGGFRNEWESVLTASGTMDAFLVKYGDPVQRNIESHMFFDSDNASSVAACVLKARENARIVRTAITGQVWDALNGAYEELKDLQRTERSQLSLSALVDWTRATVAMFRGAATGTMLRNDGYHFLRLGNALERGDSTARLINVKYYTLLPEVSLVGSGLDNYQWITLLRAVSSYRAFGWAYGGEITAAKVADFLILNLECPRSLRTSLADVCDSLEFLARAYDRPSEAQAVARRMMSLLAEARIEDIMAEGLHEVLTDFLRDLNELSGAIHASYFTGRVA